MPNSPIASEGLPAQSESKQTFRFALVALTSLFFMWGFLTALNDILIPYLKSQFSLSYTQAMLIQFCFFGAYFLVSLPAGALVQRIGYQSGIVFGLIIAGIGCLLFYPAASIGIYGIFLLALFVLASGITILQVSANPYVTILGDPKTASSRLTLTQAFNSLGTTLAPSFGAILILSTMGESNGISSDVGSQDAVKFPYLLLAGALLILAIVFAFLKLPKIAHDTHSNQAKSPHKSAWRYRHLVLGAVAIFVYVGAEVGIGSFLVNFISLRSIAGIEESQAAHYVTYYFGGAMVGRFIGAAVMQKIPAGKALAFNSVCACILITIAIFTQGFVAMWSILLVGLCNSIMFPTIFTLAIAHLGIYTSQGSGILCLAIVGGAFLPLLQGITADSIGIQMAFFIPLMCYLYIAYYGLLGHKPSFQNNQK
ncbi:sugar MFS transporter [Aliikangiella marina]|uniref:Sugar MFS transporter n=1 Tax=Aliikangiella marina TaxID=1712262 RepID=A0A545T191_9GAMM|nr:sugar MFS transporter [Aliikangiella marina]TQV70972.1 sugar MFS transporter [Aliikangiella marina]